MSWELTVRLRGPLHVTIEIDPLPSRLAQVVVLVEPGRTVEARRRLERFFMRPVVNHATGRRSWVPMYPPRAVTWRSTRTTRGEWWICGPFAHAGDEYARILAQLNGRCIASRMRRRALILVDARTGAELRPELPAPVLVHLPDLVSGDDDARAA